MYIYYQNNRATFFNSSETETGSSLENVFDPALELRAEFKEKGKVTINGRFNGITAVDSFCLGNTNAWKYKLITSEGESSGVIRGRITINNFDELVFIGGFTLELECDEEEKLYIGYLFLGQKTSLPRFAIMPQTGVNVMSSASRSFGGQVFGVKQTMLKSFGVTFPRLTIEERDTIIEYIKTVQTVEPHIIDPYYEARDKFSPMYVTLIPNQYSFPKRDEDGFYFTGSLEWQEAR
jgi:hypothetical protein